MNDVFKVKFTQVDAFFGGIDAVDLCRIHVFKDLIGFLEYIDIGYFICDIVFAGNTDGTCLHTQVHILGH